MDTPSPDSRRLPGDLADDVECTDPQRRAAFGAFLREARERRRLTLQQVSSDTKIAPRHLSALEDGNVKTLPKGMYRRAMLRAYAESVGLDKDAALDQFERTFHTPPHAPPLPARQPAEAAAPVVARAAAVRERRGDTRVLVATVVVAAIAVVALITGGGDERFATTQAADAPRRIQTVTRPDEAGPPTPVADSEPANTPLPVEGVTAREPRPASAVVQVSQPAGGRQAEPELETISATSGAAVSEPPARPLASEGQLLIESQPAGARVTVNGMGWGTTPVTVRHLPFGAKRVRVTKDGYTSAERVITVSPASPAGTIRLQLAAK